MMTVEVYISAFDTAEFPGDYIAQISLEGIPWTAGFNSPTANMAKHRAIEFWDTILKHRGDTEARRNARLENLQKARDERKIKSNVKDPV